MEEKQITTKAINYIYDDGSVEKYVIKKSTYFRRLPFNTKTSIFE